MAKKQAIILDGQKLAKKIKLDLAKKINHQSERPDLAVIMVGDNQASELYLKLKEKACQEIGVNCHKYLANQKCYPNISREELLKLINFLNQDREVDGILVQLPLPKKYDRQEIIKAINPAKDVDGFHPQNRRSEIIPPTVAAVIELLKATGQRLSNKKTAVVGKSEVFLKGIAAELKNRLKIKTVVEIPAEIKNPENLTDYDIVVTALGRPHWLKKSAIKQGATVIDIGIAKKQERTTGDAAPEIAAKAGFLSPVPGGVGPLTVACLLRNVWLLQQKKSG